METSIRTLIFLFTQQPAVSAESNEKVEQLVRERVAEELKRARSQQEQVNKRAYGDLAKQNIDNDHNSVAMAEDIDNMIQKLQRYILLDTCFKSNHF